MAERLNTEWDIRGGHWTSEILIVGVEEWWDPWTGRGLRAGEEVGDIAHGDSPPLKQISAISPSYHGHPPLLPELSPARFNFTNIS